MPKPKGTLAALERSRQHIETMWVRGTWFKWVYDDEKGDGEQMPDGARVTGVCLAGSVLYALDYTDEQWTDKKDVKPVIEALFDALPERSQAAREAQKELRDLSQTTYNWDGLSKAEREKRVYDTKVGAVITFNDKKGRRKSEVLEVFDRAIENVRASTPITINEIAI